MKIVLFYPLVFRGFFLAFVLFCFCYQILSASYGSAMLTWISSFNTQNTSARLVLLPHYTF